jgi:PAS domain S-box-containing protein
LDGALRGRSGARGLARSRPELLALLAFLLVYVSWLAVDWIPGSSQELQIAFLAPIDTLVVYACWQASRRCREAPWLRRFWILVMLGWVAELIADLILGLYDIVLDDPTFPSLADLFFLCFYPLLTLALLRIPIGPRTRSQRLQNALDSATVVVGGGAAIWYFDLGHAITESAGPFLETAVTIAYQVGDLVLLGALALVLVRGYPEALRLPLRLLTAGLLMLIVADTVYGHQQLHGSYAPGDPVDALYVLTAVPFVLAAASQRRAAATDAAARVGGRAAAGLHVSRLPLLAMVAGIAVLLGTQWQDKFFPDLSLLIFVLVLGVLAICRQYVAQRELVQLQERVRTIVESVADGIVTFDERGQIIWVNPAAEEAFQVAPGQLEGDAVDSLFEGVGWAEMAPLLGVGGGNGGAGTVIGRRRTLTGLRRDGATFPLEMIVTDARLDGERVLIAVGQDVSARKEAERVKDEFVSLVGHELRTPLTSIRGSLGLLEGGVMGDMTPEARTMLETAVDNTDRLVRLINEILDIERIDSGRAGLAFEPVPAARLIEQAIQVIQAFADEAGIEIRGEAGGVEVAADADRIVQTLTNLLANAVKFSERGGLVEVRAEREGAEVVFSVSDSGRGIPADRLEAVFERFTQVDASDAREKGGTGLGLAISRSIVEQHGGRIWAESREGEGATFYFALALAGGEGV